MGAGFVTAKRLAETIRAHAKKKYGGREGTHLSAKAGMEALRRFEEDVANCEELGTREFYYDDFEAIFLKHNELFSDAVWCWEKCVEPCAIAARAAPAAAAAMPSPVAAGAPMDTTSSPQLQQLAPPSPSMTPVQSLSPIAPELSSSDEDEPAPAPRKKRKAAQLSASPEAEESPSKRGRGPIPSASDSDSD